jgi:hypothetical protein
MSRLKKFNEMFDDESLKAENEREYLDGTLIDRILKGKKIWTKNDGSEEFKMVRLLNRLIESGLHQLLVFIFKPDIGLQITKGDFPGSLLGHYADESDMNTHYTACVLQNDKYQILFGIKINADNNYDFFIFCNGYESDSYLVRNLKYPGLLMELTTKWLEEISIFENEELESYGEDYYLEKNN